MSLPHVVVCDTCGAHEEALWAALEAVYVDEVLEGVS